MPGTSLGSGDVAVNKLMRPALVELTFRVRWDKKKKSNIWMAL